jgi:hypothetical protein
MSNKRILSIVIAIGLVGSARAQEAVPSGATRMAPRAATTESGLGMGFQFVSGEPALATHVFKGAPFSLEASIEMAQTLADGNRIVHRQTVHLYRDSKGRTRREETLAAIGPWASSGTPPTMITIQDPVTGASYFLDPQKKIAAKLPSAPQAPRGKGVMVTKEMIDGGLNAPVPATVNSGPPGGEFVFAGEQPAMVIGFNRESGGQGFQPEENSESIGKEMIAGLSADGTRTTTTIPANAIGNESPIEIVKERWYSPDLQIVLQSMQADPRLGQTTYRVTKLNRGEPSPSLFEVPSDYKVQEPETHTFTRQKSDAK